jgi:hypothetical protein
VVRSSGAILVVSFLAPVLGCNNDNPQPRRLSEVQVLPIAERALKGTMPPEYVDKYKPYRAEFRDGLWHVFGTLPGNGPGGTPEARVRDRDGEVLQVLHSQ